MDKEINLEEIEKLIEKIQFDTSFTIILTNRYDKISSLKTIHGRLCYFLEELLSTIGVFSYRDKFVNVDGRLGIVDVAVRSKGKRIGIEVEDGNQDTYWCIEKLKTFDGGIVVALNKAVWFRYLNYLVGKNNLKKILKHNPKTKVLPSKYKITLLPLFLR